MKPAERRERGKVDASKERILTGDRPTGPLHIGHYSGALRLRLEFQESGHELFVVVADLQALTDNAHRPSKVVPYVREVALDNLAVGIDPSRPNVSLFVQSAVPELCELTFLLMNMTTLSRCLRNPTVKTEIREKKFGSDVPLGFVAYPVSQASDILGFDATCVPVGADQVPVVEHTREIAQAVNSAYGAGALILPRPLVTARESQRRIVGIDGKGKMSKSLGNAIYLSDPDAVMAEKVRRMYTDPSKAGIEGPGAPEQNPVYQYLDAFDPDRQGFEALRERYRAGGVSETAGKERLLAVLRSLLDPIRKRREELARQPEIIDRFLQEGNERARAIVRGVVDRLRGRIGLGRLG